MNAIDNFLEERSRIPIPSGDAAWVKLLAKELAIGANRNLWSPRQTLGSFVGGARALNEKTEAYFDHRWSGSDLDHLLDVLLAHEYLSDSDTEHFPQLTARAFDLLNETEPYNIFISYKRSESSALALLVLARLKEHGLVPFVDMALEAGDNWHAQLEDKIRQNDYFIILLGEDTLESNMTVQEITWALAYKKTIIPVWHSGFDLAAEKWADVDSQVQGAIQQTNAIRVTDESASGYNSAIVELLNRFGITP